MKVYLTIVALVGWVTSFCQDSSGINLTIDGEIVIAKITDEDTLYIADLDRINVTSKRKFENREEYLLYLRYRRYANKVYPYAVEAIRIFRELEQVTPEMKARHRRKHIKDLHKELKDEFGDPLKGLSKTQGRILIYMIEKELKTPMYFLIKDLRSGLTARYWNTMGALFGYKLREGYIRGEDPILDMVLDDFNISHSTK
jgi:hypothetical protein